MTTKAHTGIELHNKIEESCLEQFAELMIKKIEKLNKNWKQPWFSTNGMMPENVDGREYNGMNIFMLLAVQEFEGYATPIYGTSDAWFKLNKKGTKGDKCIHTIKGQHSFPVCLFHFKVVNKETKETIPFDTYNNLNGDHKDKYAVYPRLSYHFVYNLDQTNMKEVNPKLYEEYVAKNKVTTPKGNKFHLKSIDKMVDDNLWVCPIKPKKQDGAYYSPSKDEIIIPKYEQFKDGQSYYSTMFHEMTHSTGTEERLNRDLSGGFGSKIYAREELIAEMTSAIICHLLGFGNGVKEESAAYLKGWVKNLKEDTKFIKSVLIDVRKAYNMISTYINSIK